MDIERKLVSIRRIREIEPIEGADRIVKATVGGWELVTQKSNNFKEGDLIIYFEIDSFLPVEEHFEFLRKGCFKSTKNLGDGFRIKTIKLRGQISQGLILPLSDFFDFDGETSTWNYRTSQPLSPELPLLEEGANLTSYFKVQKYEAPLPQDSANFGRAKGNFPTFIPKTDQERIQNCFGPMRKWVLNIQSDVVEVDNTGLMYAELEKGANYNRDGISYFKSGDIWFKRTEKIGDDDVIAQRESFEATLKLDGSSMTVYMNEQKYGVCSRNLELTRDEENVFWKVALKGKIIEALHRVGGNYAIQGELMGPGVQGNREKLKDHKLFIFDVFNIDTQKYLLPNDRWDFVLDLHTAGMDVEWVDEVPLIDADLKFNGFSSAGFLTYAERESLTAGVTAEGVVFKSNVDSTRSFKAISNKYLLNEKD